MDLLLPATCRVMVPDPRGHPDSARAVFLVVCSQQFSARARGRCWLLSSGPHRTQASLGARWSSAPVPAPTPSLSPWSAPAALTVPVSNAVVPGQGRAQ